MKRHNILARKINHFRREHPTQTLVIKARVMAILMHYIRAKAPDKVEVAVEEEKVMVQDQERVVAQAPDFLMI